MFLSYAYVVHGYLICLLVLTALIGDFLVSHTMMHSAKALFDNTTHAMIGGISWLSVRMHHRTHLTNSTLMEVLVCTVLSSLIDVDHFIAAKSVYLRDATNLQNRPFLHCSSVPLALTIVTMFCAYVLQLGQLQRLSLIVFTAFASHHTRDATRRGYWLFPFGSTPPIPYVLYLIIIVGIPYFVTFVMDVMKMGTSYGLKIDV